MAKEENNNKLFIPEIQLKAFLDELLEFIKEDFNSHTNENDTLLAIMLKGNKIGDFDYFTEAKDLFLREADHARPVTTRLFFDRDKANLPSMHINLPSEQPGPDGIGVDAGFNENEINSLGDEIKVVYNRAFQSVYNIIITSDNPFEVLIIYHVIRALIVSFFDSLELIGFRNPKLGGQDLILNEMNVPNNIMVRAISISSFYEVPIPSGFSDKIVKKLNLGRIKILDEEGDTLGEYQPSNN